MGSESSGNEVASVSERKQIWASSHEVHYSGEKAVGSVSHSNQITLYCIKEQLIIFEWLFMIRQ